MAEAIHSTPANPPPLSDAARGALDDVAAMGRTAPEPATGPSLVTAADLGHDVHRGLEVLDHFRENTKIGLFTSPEEYSDAVGYLIERIGRDVQDLNAELGALMEASRVAKGLPQPPKARPESDPAVTAWQLWKAATEHCDRADNWPDDETAGWEAACAEAWGAWDLLRQVPARSMAGVAAKLDAHLYHFSEWTHSEDASVAMLLALAHDLDRAAPHLPLFWRRSGLPPMCPLREPEAPADARG